MGGFGKKLASIFGQAHKMEEFLDQMAADWVVELLISVFHLPL